MSKTLVYPSGFHRCMQEVTGALVYDLKKPRNVYVERFDQEVENLFLDWTVDLDPQMDWQRRRKFILYYNKLYGDFWTWLKQQVITNDYIYDVNFDFLVDTVRFLLTGRRHMHVRNWRDLINEFPEYRPGVASQDRWEYLLQETGLSENNIKTNYIGMWCKYDSGFEDLVYTTQIIFGRPISPISR